MVKLGKIFTLIFLLHLLPYAALAAQDQGKADYWLSRYKEVNKGPIYTRSMDVFSKVLAASDKRRGVEPRLHIIEYSGLPWAQSLEDGSIILTKRAVEFCYAAKDRDVGDSRLAFVIGHELAHQFNGDFWPYRFIKSTSNNPEFSGVKETARSPDVIKTIELEADQYGAIYAALAGFRMDAVISRDANFFKEWSKATYSAMTGLSPDNPTVNQRAIAVVSRLKEVTSRLELFHAGVIAGTIGWHRESIALFEEFLRYYPGREVYHNIGTAYLKLALKNYRASKGANAMPFGLSIEVDPSTKADSIEVGRTEERTSKDYKSYLAKSIDYFKKASESDPSYAVSRNNLGAAYILDEDYHRALSELEEASRLRPESRGIINNRGVAYFLLGESLKDAGLKERAIKEFEKAASESCGSNYKKNLLIAERMAGRFDNTALALSEDIDKMTIPDINIAARMGSRFNNAGFEHIGEVKVDGGTLTVYKSKDNGEVVLVKGGIPRLAFRHTDRIAPSSRQGCNEGGIVISREEGKGFDSEGKIFFTFQK